MRQINRKTLGVYHRDSVRIYYEDTDSGGVVYYANYLKFAERARTEMLRHMGFSNSALDKEQGILFVIRRAAAEYIRPARLDDVLEIQTSVQSMKHTHVVLEQNMLCNGVLYCTVAVTLVCIDRKKGKPVRFPDNVADGFRAYINERQEHGRDCRSC